ncbi:Survival of motor neuron-related-splicing factor [Musa troglodytarum]|uniref:Survival of motor neuron-related-splicing factor n=1 Tax=Musa troglodytarum TaxID=320322 RepID=A0A9E7I139_9LILI|nr:Survival of motor neuron-related-splicing factor [Musa troglodytarum]
MQGGDDLSIEQLASNLSTYKDQLREVSKLLTDDPGNSEYADMEKELEEVIALTEELLATTKPTDVGQLHTDASPQGQFGGPSQSKVVNPSLIASFWSEDGEWYACPDRYDATIEAITPNGYYVYYDGWGNKEEVDHANVRPVEEGDALLEAEREAEATRQAIKRKIAQSAITDFQARTLPAKLMIDPNDPDDVKAAKRKKIHAFKSKVRSEQLEVAQNKRQNAWQQFQSTKGKTKKIGFFSGRKRESIFKSPDDPRGKVGVTGSGKGLTEFQKREKHLHLKGGTVDADADD